MDGLDAGHAELARRASAFAAALSQPAPPPERHEGLAEAAAPRRERGERGPVAAAAAAAVAAVAALEPDAVYRAAAGLEPARTPRRRSAEDENCPLSPW